jgi:hypothetical protein
LSTHFHLVLRLIKPGQLHVFIGWMCYEVQGTLYFFPLKKNSYHQKFRETNCWTCPNAAKVPDSRQQHSGMNQYTVGLKLRISVIVDIQTGWMIRGSSPEGGKEMYLFPKIQACSLFTGYRGSFPEPKQRRCKFYLSYPSSAELWSYTHVAPIRLCGLDSKNFIITIPQRHGKGLKDKRQHFL